MFLVSVTFYDGGKLQCLGITELLVSMEGGTYLCSSGLTG